MPPDRDHDGDLDGDRDEPMDTAELRLRELLHPLAVEPGPDDPDLAARVARAARRQRGTRRLFLAAGHLAAALAEGLGLLTRRGRT